MTCSKICINPLYLYLYSYLYFLKLEFVGANLINHFKLQQYSELWGDLLKKMHKSFVYVFVFVFVFVESKINHFELQQCSELWGDLLKKAKEENDHRWERAWGHLSI